MAEGRGQRAEASKLTVVGGESRDALGPFQLGSPSNYSTWGRGEPQSHSIPRGRKVGRTYHLGSRWWKTVLAQDQED